MKINILLLFIALCQFGFSQIWAPINPNWGPHFSVEGETEPAQSIRIIEHQMDEEPLYLFSPRYEKCTNCIYPEAICLLDGIPSSDTLYLRKPSLVGDSLKIIDGTYWFYDIGITFNPYAALNSVSTYNLGGEELSVEVVESNFELVLGSMDSTKTFQFSNGNSCTISKNHGFVSIQTGSNPAYALSGIPELQLGEYSPNLRDFYDYEIGDVFMYRTYSHGTDGISNYDNYGNRRIEITGVQNYADSVHIEYNATVTNTLEQDGVPSETQYHAENLTKTFDFRINDLKGVLHNMVVLNLDSLKSLGHNYPEDYLSFEPYIYASRAQAVDYFGRLGLKFGGSNASLGIDNVEPTPILFKYNYGEPSGWSSLSSFEDSLQQTQFYDYCLDGLEFNIEFAAGLGITSFIDEQGLAGFGHYMTGYQKGEEIHGYVPTVGEVLATDDLDDFIKTTSIYPNPNNGKLTITSGQLIDEIEISNLNGKVVQAFEVPSGVYPIFLDISNFTAGIYTIRIHSAHGMVVKKLVKY